MNRRIVLHHDTSFETRDEDGAAPVIEGYASVFDVDSKPLGFGSFVERIKKGAFAKTIKDGGDVVALRQHNPAEVLGRTIAGSLTLKEDTHGLRYRIIPDLDIGYIADTWRAIKAGLITHSSFGFEPVKSEVQLPDEDHPNDPVVVTRTEVKLLDVSPVTFPAYPQASVEARDGYLEALSDAADVDVAVLAAASTGPELRSLLSLPAPPPAHADLRRRERQRIEDGYAATAARWAADQTWLDEFTVPPSR